MLDEELVEGYVPELRRPDPEQGWLLSVSARTGRNGRFRDGGNGNAGLALAGKGCWRGGMADGAMAVGRSEVRDSWLCFVRAASVGWIALEFSNSCAGLGGRNCQAEGDQECETDSACSAHERILHEYPSNSGAIQPTPILWKFRFSRLGVLRP